MGRVGEIVNTLSLSISRRVRERFKRKMFFVSIQIFNFVHFSPLSLSLSLSLYIYIYIYIYTTTYIFHSTIFALYLPIYLSIQF